MKNTSRRDFFLASLGATAGSLFLPNVSFAKEQSEPYQGGLVTGQPKPLRYKSIPGFLSEEQITPHHKAHYGGALRGYVAADERIQSSITDGTTIDSSAYGALQRARTNKADSVLLHELYFDGMSEKRTVPGEAILSVIKMRFGTFEKWAIDFQASAKAASGWALLVFHPLNGKLYNVVSDKHATGVLWMAIPLVVIDVYEHAYYVDYKNNKAAYIERFMEHIDWKEADRRFKQISV
jgi:Fe-Mn family superoxide dismutase